MNKLKKLISIVFILMLLFGCGGGGGSSSPTNTPSKSVPVIDNPNSQQFVWGKSKWKE